MGEKEKDEIIRPESTSLLIHPLLAFLKVSFSFRSQQVPTDPFSCVSAAERNSWPESNTESHIENVTFDQNQMDFSTAVSKEGVRTQTPRKNHTSSDAPENFAPQTEAADAGGRNDSSGKTNFTISSVGADTATALTSQSITIGEFVPVMARFMHVCPLLENEVSASLSSPA